VSRRTLSSDVINEEGPGGKAENSTEKLGKTALSKEFTKGSLGRWNAVAQDMRGKE